MKDSDRYLKIVEWSDEDQCYVGRCPGLFYGGCHGDNEQTVFAELCQIVDETIALIHQERKPLPPATAGQGIAERIA
jgi:predicted RNase H-like HicB family nuclease